MNELISRQAAIDIVVFECGEWIGLAKEISKQLKQLPSAQPERKVGKWIRKSDWMWTCPFCGKDNAYAYNADDAYEPTVLQDFYCPNCGADMRGEQDG